MNHFCLKNYLSILFKIRKISLKIHKITSKIRPYNQLNLLYSTAMNNKRPSNAADSMQTRAKKAKLEAAEQAQSLTDVITDGARQLRVEVAEGSQKAAEAASNAQTVVVVVEGAKAVVESASQLQVAAQNSAPEIAGTMSSSAGRMEEKCEEGAKKLNAVGTELVNDVSEYFDDSLRRTKESLDLTSRQIQTAWNNNIKVAQETFDRMALEAREAFETEARKAQDAFDELGRRIREAFKKN